MKFKVTEFIRDYVRVDDKGTYNWIEIKKKYTANTWDDLTDLLMSLIDFSNGAIKFEVEKEETDEQ